MPDLESRTTRPKKTKINEADTTPYKPPKKNTKAAALKQLIEKKQKLLTDLESKTPSPKIKVHSFFWIITCPNYVLEK